MTLTITHSDIHILNMRTRIPFKYGIATMTSLPHAFVRVILDVDGTPVTGVAADHLPPKWFTKNPHTSTEEDVEEMLHVIRSAVEYSLDVEPADWSVTRVQWGGSLLERSTLEGSPRVLTIVPHAV